MHRNTAALAIIAFGSSAAAGQAQRDVGSVPVRDIGPALQKPNERPDDKRSAPTVTVPTPASSGVTTTVFIGAVNIEGGREIPRSVFAGVIENFLGKEADPRDLQALARAIASEARNQGYIFASAMVPEQAVASGMLTVRLEAGSVDRVRIVGSDSARLRRTLDLIVGPAVRTETLERQLLLAGDVPGIVIVSSRYVREPTGNVLIVEARENRHSGYASVDNHGSRDTGPARLRLRYDMTDLLGGDRLTMQILATPLQPAELGYASVRYMNTVNAAGTEVGLALAAGRTRPGNRPANRPVTGNSAYAAAFINHPVIRSTAGSIWANAEVALQRIEREVRNVPSQRDDIATLTVSGTGTFRALGGRVWAGGGVIQGLGFAGTTTEGDPMASRFDGSARFTKGFYWANWTGNIGKGFSLRLASNGQIASRPLLSVQEIGLGGPYFGRGYDFSERFGDNGVLGSAEMRRLFSKPHKAVKWLQLYAFVDGGYVENLSDDYGDGGLASAGGGLRAMFGRTEVGVEAGFPIGDPRFDSGDRSPRINLSIGQSF